jgi:hypothetical protein
MKVNVSGLSGRALNYAVAVVEWGEPTEISRNGAFETTTFWWDHEGVRSHLIRTKDISSIGENFSPSSNWAHGGRLVEKYCMSIDYMRSDENFVSCCAGNEVVSHDWACDENPLTAICRAVVLFKIGDEIDIPDELIEVE